MDLAFVGILNHRVLFLTPEAFKKLAGGGIIFNNSFVGWPVDDIATIHSDSGSITVARRKSRLA